MKMLDQSVAFPRKVNLDQYMPVIEAANKAAKGADGLPRVVVEEYENLKLATRAANAIRKYSKDHELNLRVSLPENSSSVYVYKAKPYHKKAKSEPVPPQPAPEEKPAEG